MTKILITKDGSKTIYSDQFDDQYHSIFGAVQESDYIYIQAGLNYLNLDSINIFEVGFGTGLNTILTYKESLKKNIKINYYTIELFPLTIEIINQLNYLEILSEDQKLVFKKLHECEWNQEIEISENFRFKKIDSDFQDYFFDQGFDLIYFDAFAPDKQPRMWNVENFDKIYKNVNNKGILITYSSKGLVKRNLRDAGFKLSRINGPEGKRHILRAQKI